MKYLITGFICAICFSVYAQNNIQGIQFENGSTWNEILAKAKATNKYIFVDCYATWCGPCKEMDKFVYTSDSVAQFFNERFISVKIQMDSSKKDDDAIKLLYPAARVFEKKYSISGLPTFLFFSKDGVVLHKSVGGKSVQDFIALGTAASNPEKQIYTIVRNVVDGKIDVNHLPGIIKDLKKGGEDSLAAIVAKSYISKYLNTLNDDELLNKEQLNFINVVGYRAVSSKDKLFKVIYRQPKKVDSILSFPGFSKDFITSIIRREHIKVHLMNAKKLQKDPNWQKIFKTISKKYNSDVAEYAVLDAKIDWFRTEQNWNAFTTSVCKKWTLYQDEFNNYDAGYLNGLAWTLCIHERDKEKLKVALGLANMAILKDSKVNSKDSKVIAAMLDTRANILYKLGDANQAVQEMEKVLNLYKERSKGTEWDKMAINYYQKIIGDMQKGVSIELKD